MLKIGRLQIVFQVNVIRSSVIEQSPTSGAVKRGRKPRAVSAPSSVDADDQLDLMRIAEAEAARDSQLAAEFAAIARESEQGAEGTVAEAKV